MNSRHGAAAVALGIVFLASPPVQAQVAQPGRLLASNCFQCHGTNGKGPGFETLAGKSASEIFKELKEMQQTSEDKGIMQKHAFGYSDAQLQALATWFSKQ